MSTTEVDHIVVANGVFSTPCIPALEGRDEFEELGGQVHHTSSSPPDEAVRDCDVVVVGYGKSACDSAVYLASRAKSTTVVTRKLLWKVPRHLWRFPLKYLLLTRFAEALFVNSKPTSKARSIGGRGRILKKYLFNILQWAVCRQLRLHDADLVPDGPIEDIARSSISVASTGFVEAVLAGTIRVVTDVELLSYGSSSRSALELSDGRSIPADTVVFGTGYVQEVPFFAADVRERLLDQHGDFLLYRNIHSPVVSGVSFAGYNSSLISPLSAEVGAHWIAALLAGQLDLPSVSDQRRRIEDRLSRSRRRTDGKHARGASVVPFSLQNIDELMSDLGVHLSVRARIVEWFSPPEPAAYRQVLERLRQQLLATTSDQLLGE